MKLLVEERTLSDAIRAYTAKCGQMGSVYPTEPEDYNILKNAIKNSVITLDKDIYRGMYFKSKDWEDYFYRWHDGKRFLSSSMLLILSHMIRTEYFHMVEVEILQ